MTTSEILGNTKIVFDAVIAAGQIKNLTDANNLIQLYTAIEQALNERNKLTGPPLTGPLSS